MYKKLLIIVLFMAVLSTVFMACSIHEAGGPAGPTVNMSAASFDKTSITIKKGDSLNLVDTVAVEHIITNGTWKNGIPAPAKEPGAVSYNSTFNGNDSGVLGPFTTAGTFHYYCTLHPGMEIAVVVS